MMPLAARLRRSVGTPVSIPGGSLRILPREYSAAVVVAAGITSIPSSRHRFTASGRVASMASAPTSTPTPLTSLTRSLPPNSSPASRSVTVARWSLVRNQAAASPLMPPPTITTCGMLTVGSYLPEVVRVGARPRPRR